MKIICFLLFQLLTRVNYYKDRRVRHLFIREHFLAINRQVNIKTQPNLHLKYLSSIQQDLFGNIILMVAR